jgi:hypothetical protein
MTPAAHNALLEPERPSSRNPNNPPTSTQNTQPGDTISVKGPMGKFDYAGAGSYVFNRRPGSARWLSFVAGGSGITPCYAVRALQSARREAAGPRPWDKGVRGRRWGAGGGRCNAAGTGLGRKGTACQREQAVACAPGAGSGEASLPGLCKHCFGLNAGFCSIVTRPVGAYLIATCARALPQTTRPPSTPRSPYRIPPSPFTPCLPWLPPLPGRLDQVIREALSDPSDPTRLSLLYANKGEGDIWLRHELDAFAAKHPDRCGPGFHWTIKP